MSKKKIWRPTAKKKRYCYELNMQHPLNIFIAEVRDSYNLSPLASSCYAMLCLSTDEEWTCSRADVEEAGRQISSDDDNATAALEELQSHNLIRLTETTVTMVMHELPEGGFGVPKPPPPETVH